MTAQIHMHRRLPATEIYACSKNEAKAIFQGMDELHIHFGDETHYEFAKGVHHPPKINGWVIASATVNREGEASVSLFPIRKEGYAEYEHQTVVEAEFVKMRSWLQEQQAVPEAQIVSNRQLILESVVDGFVQHRVEFA